MAGKQAQKEIKMEEICWRQNVVVTQVPKYEIDCSIYKQILLQDELQIQYYIYEDLANFLGILVEVLETIQHFKEYSNHEYIKIAINRLITQRNLSYSIHKDCCERFSAYQKEKLEAYQKEKLEVYQKEKLEAYKIFAEYIEQLEGSYLDNPYVRECVNDYLDCLKSVQPHSEFFKPLIYTNRNSNFNIGVVEKVFQGMQQVDQKYQEIKKGIYKKLKQEEILKILQERKERAKNLLESNFEIKDKVDIGLKQRNNKLNLPKQNQDKRISNNRNEKNSIKESYEQYL